MGIFADIVKEVRLDLNDSVGGAGQLWGDDELTKYGNEGQNEIARRAYAIIDYSTASVCQVTMLTNQAAYTKDSSILLIDSVLGSDSEPLQKRTEEWLDVNNIGWRTASAGKPQYFVEKKSALWLVPKPSSTYNGLKVYLTVRRLPLKPVSITGTPAVDPEISSTYYEDLKNWMKYRAYMKQDAQTLNEKKAAEYLQLFNASIGDRTSANIERIIQEETPNSMCMAPVRPGTGLYYGNR